MLLISGLPNSSRGTYLSDSGRSDISFQHLTLYLSRLQSFFLKLYDFSHCKVYLRNNIQGSFFWQLQIYDILNISKLPTFWSYLFGCYTSFTSKTYLIICSKFLFSNSFHFHKSRLL